MNENGLGTLEVNSIDYSSNGVKTKCSFGIQTLKGIDYRMELRGAKVLDTQGKAGNYLCYEGDLSVTINKQKRKKWFFPSTRLHTIRLILV